jgi:ADP-ribosyl-[dinitrogen reductase] hydrolase
MSSAAIVDKVKGCFLGLAVGDALGVPVEFKSRSYLAENPVTGMQGYGVWNQPPGTWSDDSSLSFCLAESLVQGYNPMDIGAKFSDWFTQGYWGAHGKLFDIGNTTRVALNRIKMGLDPRFAGETGENSNGNGSLMRIAPAALYFSSETDEALFEKIKEISSMTHGHFRSIFACFIYSKILIELCQGNDKRAAHQNTISSIQDFVKRNQFDDLELRPFQWVLSDKWADMKAHQISSSGYVMHTLEASVWCLLTSESYSETVLKAVNLGSDTDTTGCVAGALAGVYYGTDSIPKAWLEVLARKEDIIKLSEDFAAALKA